MPRKSNKIQVPRPKRVRPKAEVRDEPQMTPLDDSVLSTSEDPPVPKPLPVRKTKKDLYVENKPEEKNSEIETDRLGRQGGVQQGDKGAGGEGSGNLPGPELDGDNSGPILPENEDAATYRAKRRVQVSEFYLKGIPQVHIAHKLGVPVQTVGSDLRKIRAEWIKRAALAFDERKAQELARVDRIEEQAWAGWDRSIESQTVHHSRKKSVRQAVRDETVDQTQGNRKLGRLLGHKMVPIEVSEETTVKGQSGDPRFLEQIAHCVELRLRILGLWKGDSVTSNTLVIDWGGLFQAQAERREIEDRKHEAMVLGEVVDMKFGLEDDPVEAKIRSYEGKTGIVPAADIVVRR